MEHKQLNEALGLAIRRAFQLQLAKRRCTPNELRQHFSELYAVLDTLMQPHKAVRVRKVFADPETQWLSRSAIESGVAMTIGGYLVHLAELPASEDTMEAVARTVLHVLLDQLLESCSVRTGGLSAVCEWRDVKPKYHTMPCFAVWTTLSPMIERLAIRFPHVLVDVLSSYASKRAGRRRVNCNFAQVSGLWHLIEALGAAGKVTKETLSALLRFLIQSVVLQSNGEALSVAEEAATEVEIMRVREEVINTANYHDLLLDKFFSGLQTFLFHCKGSKSAAESAMQATILERLTTGSSSMSLSLTVVTSVSSAFVNGLASRIASRLIKALQTTQRANESALLFCVGLCAHVDMVSARIVMLSMHHLLARYAAVPLGDTHSRQKIFFLLLYIAVHRQRVVDTMQEGQASREESDVKESGSSDSTTGEWNARLSLLSFQERVIGQVQEPDFYVMPIAWMHILWTKWLGLSEEEAIAFSESARRMQHEETTTDDQPPQNGQEQPLWKIFPSRIVVTELPFRRIAQRYALLETLQRTHWIAPVDLESLLEKQQRRRMKLLAAQRKRIKHLAPDAHEQRLNVLMLPEVMQVVCSFMSAKRLCRMSLVCRSFNDVSHLESLWQNLYNARVASLLAVACVHGPAYNHNWKRMYVHHVQATRRMRQRRRNISKQIARQASEGADSAGDSSEQPSAEAIRICPHCDCYDIVNTQQELDQHFLIHEQCQCSRVGCGASFGSANQLRLHIQQAHPKPVLPKKTFPRPCPADGCEADPLRSAAELRKHMKQQHPEVIEKRTFACPSDGCKKLYVSEKCYQKHLLTHEDDVAAS